MKIPKNIAKEFQKLINLFPALFLAKTGWDRPRKWKKKKISVPNSVLTQPDLENYKKKKIEKKFKKLKNLIPALFLSEIGWKRPGKREKYSSPEFCSYPTQIRKF